MGLNSHGYRTDPGPQTVKVSLIRCSVIAKQEEMLSFISSGEQPPRFKVRWNEKMGAYFLEDPADAAIFAALSYLGYAYVDVLVLGAEEPLDDVEVEEE